MKDSRSHGQQSAKVLCFVLLAVETQQRLGRDAAEVVVQLLSHAQLLETSWIVAC